MIFRTIKMLFSSQVSDIQNILQSKKGTTIGGFYLSRACHVLLSKTLTQFSEPPLEGAVVYSNMTAFLKTTSSDHLGVSLDGGYPQMDGLLDHAIKINDDWGLPL